MADSVKKTKKLKKQYDDYPLASFEKSDGIGEALQTAYLKSTLNDGKKRRNNKELLESLKKGGGALQKDEDNALLLANTYNPDSDPKNTKSNKQRQKKQTTDIDNPASIECENETSKNAQPKTKKKKKEPALIEEMPEAVEMHNLSKLHSEPIPAVRMTKRKKSPKRAILSDNETSKGPSDCDDDVKEAAKLDIVDETKQDNKSPEKKPRKKKKAKNKEESADDDDQPSVAAAYAASLNAAEASAKEDKGQVLQVIVHRSDKLKMDFYISHPLVRVHIIDIETGDYLKKKHKDRPVSSRFETENDKVDFILPIMTMPFDFKKNHSTLPIWEDHIIFNENFNYFVSPERNVLLIFELLDFVSMNTTNKHYNNEAQSGGWNHIAWSFLKLVGANGEPNTGKKVRLQLYLPPSRFYSKHGHAEVFSWWNNTQRIIYPSTLYVTVMPIVVKKGIEPSTRSMFAVQEERGRLGFDDIQNTIDGLRHESRLNAQQLRQTSPWVRLVGQQCKIPNILMCSLTGGRKGCFVVKFSHNGLSLACGCHGQDTYPILIYEIPSGRLKSELTGHCSIIYDLSWSADDKQILSASSDGTARVWDVSESQIKTLPHPSYVYCAKYHPYVGKIVVTGGYDQIIRVWSLQTEEKQALLLQELDGHHSFVNTLCFDEDGIQLFSGDSFGTIIVWNVSVTDKASSKGLLKEWTKKKELVDPEIKGNAINLLTLHPNGRRLLVHSRNSILYLLDLRIESIMHKYVGALNFREHIRSAVSPCGSFVFAGSEDGQAYVWNTDSGDQVAVYSDLGYSNSLCDVDFHPRDNIIAFCSHGDSQPIKVYQYDPNAAKRNVICETAEPFLSNQPGGKASAMSTKDNEQTLFEHSLASMTGTGDLAISQRARYERAMQKLQTIGMQQTDRFSMESPFSPDISQPYIPTISGDIGWRPGFTPISGRTGSVRSTARDSYRPQFTFDNAEGKSRLIYTGISKQQEMVVVLYDYLAQRSDELTLICGDRIKVLYKDNVNWWMGELDDGQQGFFPANYVVSAAGDKCEKETKQEISSPQDEKRDEEVKHSFHIHNGSDAEDPAYRKTTHAVVDKSGELRYISATEESDAEVSVKRTKKKKARKSATQIRTEAQIERPPRASNTSARRKTPSPAPT